jgi:hypothetical protein
MGGRGARMNIGEKHEPTILEKMKASARRSAELRRIAIEQGLTDYEDDEFGVHWYNNGGHWDTKPVEMSKVLGFQKGKNKKETLINEVEYYTKVKLENEKGSLNTKRNVLYTKIPLNKRNTIIPLLQKRGVTLNAHANGYYFLDLTKYRG